MVRRMSQQYAKNEEKTNVLTTQAGLEAVDRKMLELQRKVEGTARAWPPLPLGACTPRLEVEWRRMRAVRPPLKPSHRPAEAAASVPCCGNGSWFTRCYRQTSSNRGNLGRTHRFKTHEVLPDVSRVPCCTDGG